MNSLGNNVSDFPTSECVRFSISGNKYNPSQASIILCRFGFDSNISISDGNPFPPLLKLRPVKLEAVKNECNDRVTEECSSVSSNVKIDWSFTTHATFKENWDYVRYCRNVSAIPVQIFVTGGNGFPSLIEIFESNPNLQSAIESCEGLYLLPDMENRTYSEVGKSVTLFPREFICHSQGEKAIVYTNTDNREKISSLPGAGISVEFGLDKMNALQREESKIQEIAARKKEREEEYRAQVLDDWQRNCERTRERNEHDVAKWQEKCQRVQERNEELCVWCRGSLSSSCSNTSRSCSSCHGTGSKTCICVLHHYPGKRHKPDKPPGRPSPSSLPSKPSFTALSSIDFRAGI